MLWTGLLTAVFLLPNAALADLAEKEQPLGLEARLWARATLPGMQSAAVYGVLHNDSDRLVVARSPDSALARHSSLHETWEDPDSGLYRMKSVGQLRIPAGGSISLAPGGLHLMLMGLSRPLKEGGKLPVSLKLEGEAGVLKELRLQVPILGPGALSGEAAWPKNLGRE